jgi:hypothetical protein
MECGGISQIAETKCFVGKIAGKNGDRFNARIFIQNYQVTVFPVNNNIVELT